MNNRNRMFVSKDAEDFATIGIPVGDDGKEMRSYLRRQELAGECRLDFTGHKMRHDDGRLYEEVAIISTHRENPQIIACNVMAYHPDWENGEYQAAGSPCPFCHGQGCQECGHTGIQGI